MPIALTLVGLLGGLLLSAAFWWWQTHLLVPNLAFSVGLSKRLIDGAGTTVYRLKIQNEGKRRAIIDLSLRARVHVPRYSVRRREAGSTSSVIEIPLDIDRIFALPPKSNRIVWLEVENIDESLVRCLDEELQQLIFSRRDGALEGLLRIRPDAYLRVQVLAYDAFSGARKYYPSKKYVADDIVWGVFDGLSLRPDDPSIGRSE